jgi:hypothetical protein
VISSATSFASEEEKQRGGQWAKRSEAERSTSPHKDYERLLTQGTKPNLAKLTLARKIAATVLSMWKHQDAYDPERHRTKLALG